MLHNVGVLHNVRVYHIYKDISVNGSFLTLAWWRGLRGGCVDLEVVDLL